VAMMSSGDHFHHRASTMFTADKSIGREREA
jgi:hypothetical protein